jgi:hypothetical protein
MAMQLESRKTRANLDDVENDPYSGQDQRVDVHTRVAECVGQRGKGRGGGRKETSEINTVSPDRVCVCSIVYAPPPPAPTAPLALLINSSNHPLCNNGKKME